jgi:tetratricopeptide (TPR) repeat protein
MRRRLVILIVCCLWLATLAGPAIAQGDVSATPLPFDTASPQASPAAAQAEPESIDDALARAEAAAARAETLLEETRRMAEDASRYAGDASSFLGLFEALGIVITVVAGAFSAFGIYRLFSAQNELTLSRKRFEQELERKESELAALEQQLRRNNAEQHAQSTRATLALSLLPLGERQYKAQDFKGACDTYERALKLDSNNPVIYYRLGYVCVQSGQLDDAVQYLTRALEIDPEFPLAMAALGYAYRRQAEKMEAGLERERLMNMAERCMLDGLALSPKLVDDDGESWWGSLGGLYRRRGLNEQAIRAYQQAAEVTPHSSYPFSNLAMLYMGEQDRDAMLRMFKRVERLAKGETQADVDNYWAYADLLTAQLALGKFSEAEEALQSLFDTAPSDSPYALELLTDTLGRLMSALGDEGGQSKRIETFVGRIRAQIEAAHAAKSADAADSADTGGEER